MLISTLKMLRVAGLRLSRLLRHSLQQAARKRLDRLLVMVLRILIRPTKLPKLMVLHLLMTVPTKVTTQAKISLRRKRATRVESTRRLLKSIKCFRLYV
jgi:hypothetical protein